MINIKNIKVVTNILEYIVAILDIPEYCTEKTRVQIVGLIKILHYESV